MPDAQLTMDERYVISHMHWAGCKPAQIARRGANYSPGSLCPAGLFPTCISGSLVGMTALGWRSREGHPRKGRETWAD
jgi:hypothetical protein